MNKKAFLTWSSIGRLVKATLAFILSAGCAHALTVSLNQTSYRTGDMVSATVTSSGSVGVENDITQQSTISKGTGARTISLGTIPAVGFYRVAFIEGPVRQDVMLFVAHNAASPPPAVQKLESAASSALEKYYSGFTKERVVKAWDQWDGKKFLAKKSVMIAVGVSFGIACANGAAPACVISGNASKDVIMDLSAELFDEVAKVQKSEGLLSASEYSTVKLVITGGKIFLGSVSGKSIEMVKGATEGVVSELLDASVKDQGTNAEVGVSVFKDQAKKTYLIIKKLK